MRNVLGSTFASASAGAQNVGPYSAGFLMVYGCIVLNFKHDPTAMDYGMVGMLGFMGLIFGGAIGGAAAGISTFTYGVQGLLTGAPEDHSHRENQNKLN